MSITTIAPETAKAYPFDGEFRSFLVSEKGETKPVELLDDAEYLKARGEFSVLRDELAAKYAERSRKCFESSRTAQDMRGLTEEVESYINGIATELALRCEKNGVSNEVAAKLIEQMIADETRQLLGRMGDERLENAADRNRFVPKGLRSLYDKGVEKWQSWDVPEGDGVLASRLRETGMWQHLESKTSGSGFGSRLGQLAMAAVSGSVNTTENLFKYKEARKRLGATLAISAGAGAFAGAVLGAAGATGAGMLFGGLLTRSAIRTGVTAKLDSDASLGSRVSGDTGRMIERTNEITSGAYSTAELLGYIRSETDRMVDANNKKLLGGVAVGVAGGLLGNTVGRGVGWLANHLLDTPAYAADLNITEVTPQESALPIGPRGPRFMMAGFGSDVPPDGPGGEGTVVGRVIEPGVESPRRVIEPGVESPRRVIDPEVKTPHRVIDPEAKSPQGEIDPPSEPNSETVKPFMVEKGHGLIREINEWMASKGEKISDDDAETMYKIIREKYGPEGIIDVHDVNMDGVNEASAVLNDTYDFNGDTRISAWGMANWRTGVTADLDKLLSAYKSGQPLSLDLLKQPPDASDTGATVSGGENTTVSANTVQAAIDKGDALAMNTIERGEGWYGTFNELRKAGLVEIDQSQYGALLKKAGPELAKIKYSDDTPVAFFNRFANEWQMNTSPDGGRLAPQAIRLIVEQASKLDQAKAA